MLPSRALTNIDIEKYCKHIKHFRGVFMLDDLPKTPRVNECAIVNLDKLVNPGTHWVAFKKKGNKSIYFDSFGKLPPAPEIQQYLKGSIIEYNYMKYQDYDTYNCGHLCIQFLTNKNI